MIALALLAILSGVDSDLSDPVPRQDRTSVYPRLDRRDRVGVADYALFRVLPTNTLPSTSAGCTGATLTGTRGESLGFARLSAATCTMGNGITVQLTSGKPRISNLGWLFEGANTNLVLQNRDLSNAAFTASSMTCALNATGTDGVASSASTCTSTGANGTILQALTVAAATRATSLYIKRVSGSGNIDITRDNGGAWTTLTSAQCYDPASFVATAPNASTFVRCWLASSVLNPTVGLRLVTSGNSVVVDMAQDEDYPFPTSPIITTGASAARAIEVASMYGTYAVAAGCAALSFVPTWTTGAGIPSDGNLLIDNNNTFRLIYINSTVVKMFDNLNPVVSRAATFTAGTAKAIKSTWSGSTDTIFDVTAGTSASGTFAAPVYIASNPNLIIGSNLNTGNGYLSNIRTGASVAACEL